MVYAFFATRIRPQKHYLTKARPTFSKRPIAVGNTGPCRPISLRSIRALATLLPLSGQYAPPLRLCARATPLRAYAYATALLPLAIRAFVALFRCAQYGLPSPYFAALNTGSCYAIAPTRGAIRSAAPAMCSPLRGLRAYAYATRPIAVGNTGQSNIIHPIHIKMILNPKHNSILSPLKKTHNDLHS